MKQNETKQASDAMATMNRLLIAIVVLLGIGLGFNVLTYFNVADLNEYIGRAFNAVYERMGRMRVY